MNLQEGWERLEEDLRTGAGRGRLQRRIQPEGRRDFFLGLQLPDRHRMLILRADPGDVADQSVVPDSRGLTVRTTISDTGQRIAEVELVLTEPQHRDIFDLLIEDLVSRAEEPADPRTGVSRFLARLSEWQRLLMRLTPAGLSPEMQQGLWGELWTLREIVGPPLGLGTAVRAWRGPLGGDQDFQIDTAALEVKTSISHAFEQLTIASERQLDVPPDVELGLVVLSLDARPGHGETLREMVNRIREAASDAGCLDLLEERLTHYGYRDDADGYTDTGYSVLSRIQFRVTGEFPRVVAQDLRDGVSEVRYSISVSACTQYRIGEEQLGELLRGEL